MRAAIQLTGEDGAGIIKRVCEESGVILFFDGKTKLAHFPDVYPSYEEAAVQLDKVEAALKKACKRDYMALVREEGAKSFSTEREYARFLVSRQREFHQLVAPLAGLAKSLAVS